MAICKQREAWDEPANSKCINIFPVSIYKITWEMVKTAIALFHFLLNGNLVLAVMLGKCLNLGLEQFFSSLIIAVLLLFQT